MLRKAFVGADEQALFVEQSRPNQIVIHSLVNGAPDVEHVMAQLNQRRDAEERGETQRKRTFCESLRISAVLR